MYLLLGAQVTSTLLNGLLHETSRSFHYWQQAPKQRLLPVLWLVNLATQLP